MNGRRYGAEFGGAMAAYCLLLVLSVHLIGHGDVTGSARVCVALLPMLAAAAACWAVLRQLGRLDELQRRLQLEALALGFAGTALITFGYGFLEMAGFPRISMFAVWPVMATLWVGALCFRRFRYA